MTVVVPPGVTQAVSVLHMSLAGFGLALRGVEHRMTLSEDVCLNV